ncbi:phosphatidic acid phosphatase type 2 domain containing protein 1B, putative [Entamoeba invadens IP1]|uniref:Phosphatidic acid phosphatase type 2 domain containing protein 1B, putative n=1 Tax=Entamoeba invadens IP1 TaxID=370355 RepID=A0A0A1U800_ENTIV|nr:phosphatidic acid phosphatase type 2 domain containing protein 1B, putative [Entamoeba invadens IP1]ELP91023.1 phosphatidic acid phosphatase type 2 domain containing protein 1B, putative [Entamoeba invadens IP1]|eukprot:XP_004257794.1 phosphatidic acid phosphatase type 2 domain containing protein 1B, putative [Entamoeba invadens IP1]
MFEFARLKAEIGKTQIVGAGIVALLVVLTVVVNAFPTHKMDIPNDNNNYNFNHTFRKSTFPFLICCILFWGINIVFIVYFAKKRNSTKYLINVLLLFAFSVALNRFATDAFKKFAGRPRPNQFSLESNGKAGQLYLSFPSGHSSMVFNASAFLFLLLCGEFKIFGGEGSLMGLFACGLPLLFAGVVAVSRTRDFYHHYEDIVAGLLIGCIISIVCYFSRFESLSGQYCGEIEKEEDAEGDNYIV